MSRGVSIDKRKNHRSIFRETNGSPGRQHCSTEPGKEELVYKQRGHSSG